MSRQKLGQSCLALNSWRRETSSSFAPTSSPKLVRTHVQSTRCYHCSRRKRYREEHGITSLHINRGASSLGKIQRRGCESLYDGLCLGWTENAHRCGPPIHVASNTTKILRHSIHTYQRLRAPENAKPGSAPVEASAKADTAVESKSVFGHFFRTLVPDSHLKKPDPGRRNTGDKTASSKTRELFPSLQGNPAAGPQPVEDRRFFRKIFWEPRKLIWTKTDRPPVSSAQSTGGETKQTGSLPSNDESQQTEKQQTEKQQTEKQQTEKQKTEKQNTEKQNVTQSKVKKLKRHGKSRAKFTVSKKPAKPSRRTKGLRPTARRYAIAKRLKQIFRDATPEELSSVEAGSLHIDALDVSNQPHIPNVQYRLDRVLFNPGVHQLQDQRTRVYNFDPYLEHIMPLEEFDFKSLKPYKTSSEDHRLGEIAKEHGKRYVGSTSSMTGVLAHFHYLLSNWRDLDLSMLSRRFPEHLASFTTLNRAPSAIFLRYKPESATYAIDVDKEFDSPNVLMMLGKSMELFLTKPREEYERHRKDAARPITEAERSAPESYQYTTMGDFLMRSQLDARDSRLPGTGTFDLKTRAVLGIRMRSDDWENMSGYEIQEFQGRFESYERELYDMMRSTLLKYSLQVRMGRMDGILLAFHNIRRIFGFQYIPVHEMDRALHGQADPSIGDQEFRLSLDLLNKVLNQATAKFPERSLRIFFVTEKERLNEPARMTICAEPVDEAVIKRVQSRSKRLIEEFERQVMGDGDLPDAVDGHSETAAADSQCDEQAGASGEAASAEGTGGSSEETSKGSEPAIYVASLTIQNEVKYERKVKFSQPPNNRLFRLKPTDTWKTNYILKEMTGPMRKRLAVYGTVKQNRKAVFDKLRKRSEAQVNKSKGASYYGRILEQLAQSGREYRRGLDTVDAGKDKLVLDQRKSKHTEQIGNLDDYMDWMYKQ